MQTILVLILNNIGEGNAYNGGMGEYWKEVTYKRKMASELTQHPLSRSTSHSLMTKLK